MRDGLVKRAILKQPIENFFNKGGLNSTLFRRIRDYSTRPPDLLWSRGWFFESDHCGDCSFLYPAYPTRYMVKSLYQLRGKQGLIWLRLGSYPINEAWGNDRIGDVASFARDVVGHLSGPTVLVTTDGDMSVPANLPPGVAEKILEDEKIKAWFTQNLDSTVAHPKLFPLPIGLGLHSVVMNRFAGIRGQGRQFVNAQKSALPQINRINRIWSDVQLRVHAHNGAPRKPLAAAIKSGRLSEIVDEPDHRLSQNEIWEIYGKYAFVMSLPGHGWDCYRTWEALGLGAIVITVHSPLDELLRDYRVIFLDSKEDNWWRRLLDKDWLMESWLEASNKPIVDLRWKSWQAMVRSPLKQGIAK